MIQLDLASADESLPGESWPDESQLNQSWHDQLKDEFDQSYLLALKQFLLEEKQQGKSIYPKANEYFAALNATPLGSVKVIVLGQDPYHGPGQAHGFCFSVRPDVAIPPSLLNIYKEIQADLNMPHVFKNGDLTDWAKQGVLLLNSVLSVRKNEAASHQGQGWEQFTDRLIELVSTQRERCVFLLWGAYAQKKGQFIDSDKHLVLKAPHPSPLSAYRGFLGCKHFSACNDYLKASGQAPIDWLGID